MKIDVPLSVEPADDVLLKYTRLLAWAHTGSHRSKLHILCMVLKHLHQWVVRGVQVEQKRPPVHTATQQQVPARKGKLDTYVERRSLYWRLCE